MDVLEELQKFADMAEKIEDQKKDLLKELDAFISQNYSEIPAFGCQEFNVIQGGWQYPPEDPRRTRSLITMLCGFLLLGKAADGTGSGDNQLRRRSYQEKVR